MGRLFLAFSFSLTSCGIAVWALPWRGNASFGKQEENLNNIINSFFY
ncbi:hypothetical protein PI172_2053 [Prevotella intermedia]|uniref:Lipoprotein n=1 Tax=Prevotella intermedia TaxID=28131 RepID=A0AAD1BKC9_PREIN|nr:hypothetical protein PI172_2053 [Prevotella intermedia]